MGSPSNSLYYNDPTRGAAPPPGTMPFSPGGGYQVPKYNPGDLTSKGGLKRGLSDQYGVNQGMMQQQQGQRSTETGSLIPGYTGMLDSGYSPQEKSGIQQGTLGAISSSYGSAKDSASRRMATTGNSAGFGGFMTSAAHGEGKDLAQQELDNQKAFADEKQKRKLGGLQGLAGLYGVDTGFLSALNNNQLGTLNAGQAVQSGRRGVLGSIGAGLSLFGL